MSHVFSCLRQMYAFTGSDKAVNTRMAKFAAEGIIVLTTAYISMGSNTGDRLANLMLAVKSLEERAVMVRRMSSVYESEAWGRMDQADFLNAVAEVETEMTALELLHVLQEIEKEGGRVRSERWGPRSIDLDILLFGSIVMATDELIIPHPRMSERRFVLVPLSEISGSLINPVDNQSVEEMIRNCTDKGLVRPYHSK